MYIQDVRSGSCDSKAVPKILKETAATAWVDGQNGLGAVIGNFCMDLAIKKAKEVGIGWVSVKGLYCRVRIRFYANLCSIQVLIISELLASTL